MVDLVILVLLLFSILIFSSYAYKRAVVLNVESTAPVTDLITKLSLTDTSGLIFFSCAWHRRKVNADLWAEVWFSHIKNEKTSTVVVLFNNIVEEMSVDLSLLEPQYREYAIKAGDIIAKHRETHTLGELMVLLEEPYRSTFSTSEGKEVV